MRILFFDCISGISGDMTVGALCDLGVKEAVFERALSQLQLGGFHLHFERQERQHISGVHFHVHDEHEHDHEHHHEHRAYAQIRAMIKGSDLSDFVKTHALSIFHRIAVAEAKIHGMPVDDVTFHEVGALDSIADIVCVCAGIEALGADEVRFSALADGHGTVKTAHGVFPVPAPATLAILAGIPLGQIDVPFELITPTGAAIAAEFGRSFGMMPALQVEKIGYGLGTRQIPGRPNVLRAVLGVCNTGGEKYLRDTVVRVETNIDDLSPEITGAVLNRLLEAGALDATLTPLQMKKNRPGVLLTVLCEEAILEKIADLIFRETTAFGIRMDRLERWKLERRLETVQTPCGEITVKRGLADGQIIQTAPEFESCRAASERTGQPLRVIYEAVFHAAHIGGG